MIPAEKADPGRQAGTATSLLGEDCHTAVFLLN
jgi:hypothetical protein